MEEIFKDLFILELANNHWGSLDRGKKIIDSYVPIIRKHQEQGLRAAIKLQFRDGEHFIHPDFLDRSDIRYIFKTKKTALNFNQFRELILYIQSFNIMAIATPFDEESVRWCDLLNLPIIKIASSDINDWPLLQAIAQLEKPVICSTGGANLDQIDPMVAFFEARNIPLAINHCVALYPTEDQDLCLNQIDLLKTRYPKHTIGFSTHEYHDWESSLLISYAKGARTFERHIDIDLGDYPVSPYCSLPDQINLWFSAYHKAKKFCGEDFKNPRKISDQEINYLNQLVRGVYAKRDLPEGYELNSENIFQDIYLAIPCLPDQLSCRDISQDISQGIFQKGMTLKEKIKKDQKLDKNNLGLVKVFLNQI